MSQKSSHSRFTKCIWFFAVLGIFITLTGHVIAQSTNTGGECDPEVDAPSCVVGGSLEIETGKCIPNQGEIKCPGDASCAGGDFCKADGKYNVKIDPLPQYPHTYLPGNTFVSNCKTDGVGDFTPDPADPDTWTKVTASQLFTFIPTPNGAPDQNGWRCEGDNCRCTAQSSGTDGAYDQNCDQGANSDTNEVDIFEQTCTYSSGNGQESKSNARSRASGTISHENWVNETCPTQEVQCANDHGTFTDGCVQYEPLCNGDNDLGLGYLPHTCDTDYLYDYSLCWRTGEAKSCLTPKGMVENDPPQCNLTFNPAPGAWTSGARTGVRSLLLTFASRQPTAIL